MNPCIIHHYYGLWTRITIAKWENVAINEFLEDLCINRSAKDTTCHVAINSKCRKQREVLCFLCCNTERYWLSFGAPTWCTLAKFRVDARFIDKNELVRTIL